MQIWIWWGIMLINSITNIYLWNKKRNKHAFFYIFINAYRATFPIIHLNNTCLFAYSSPFVERSLSTIAEIVFTIQIINLFELSNKYRIYVLTHIYIAEIYCWFGIISGNQYWHVCEEGIWCYCAIILLLWLKYETELNLRFNKEILKKFLTGYIIYMCLYDIPLYIRNSNVEKTQIFICENISADYNIWKSTLIWMTGYFTIGSWVSLAIS
jgi:hypothetical protein